MNRIASTRGMVITRNDPNKPYLNKISFGSSRSFPPQASVVSGPTNKILLVLQFWEQDKAQGMELARLIADLEPNMCDKADFMFVSRFDCKHDMKTVEYVSSKFPTFFHTSPRRGTGWPQGCNDLFYGSLEYIYHKMKSGRLPHYKSIFTFESDCCPLNRDWVSLMSHNWDLLQSPKQVFIAGRKLRSEHIHEHINGNCLLSGDFRFLEWLVMGAGRGNSSIGWDYLLADEFRRWGWAEVPGLECHWNTRTLSDQQLKSEMDRGVVWLHGVKDYSALNFARKTLL